jgi:membrane protein
MRVGAELRTIHRCFDEHEILHSASAIAFQVLFALVPLGLFMLALVGFLDLDRVWRDAAAEIRPKVSPAAFTIIDDTAQKILHQQAPFWLTAGAALAIWRLSAAMRATMGALDRVYGTNGDRSLGAEIRTSVGLSLATTVLVLAALAVVYLGPVAVDVSGALAQSASFVVRWALALALGVAAVGLLIHYAPAKPHPLGWVSRGTLLAAGCWLLGTAGFAFYVTELADYGSVFGSFATIFLLLTYLYLSATAFLVGVEIDARARDGEPAAQRRSSPGPVTARVSSSRT